MNVTLRTSAGKGYLCPQPQGWVCSAHCVGNFVSRHELTRIGSPDRQIYPKHRTKFKSILNEEWMSSCEPDSYIQRSTIDDQVIKRLDFHTCLVCNHSRAYDRVPFHSRDQSDWIITLNRAQHSQEGDNVQYDFLLLVTLYHGDARLDKDDFDERLWSKQSRPERGVFFKDDNAFTRGTEGYRKAKQ